MADGVVRMTVYGPSHLGARGFGEREGPDTVLLTTPSALRLVEIPSWVHLSPVKKAPHGPSLCWKAVPTGPLSVKLTRAYQPHPLQMEILPN